MKTCRNGMNRGKKGEEQHQERKSIEEERGNFIHLTWSVREMKEN